MKIHAVADFMCSKYELINNMESSLFTLKLNSLRFYGFIFVPGHESQRQPAVEACIAELYCSCTVLCPCVRLSGFFILKCGTPVHNTEQDALSRVVQSISLFFNKSFLMQEMMGKWLKEKKTQKDDIKVIVYWYYNPNGKMNFWIAGFLNAFRSVLTVALPLKSDSLEHWFSCRTRSCICCGRWGRDLTWDEVRWWAVWASQLSANVETRKEWGYQAIRLIGSTE